MSISLITKASVVTLGTGITIGVSCCSGPKKLEDLLIKSGVDLLNVNGTQDNKTWKQLLKKHEEFNNLNQKFNNINWTKEAGVSEDVRVLLLKNRCKTALRTPIEKINETLVEKVILWCTKKSSFYEEVKVKPKRILRK